MWVHTHAGMQIYCFMVYESNSLVMNMQRVTASNLGWSHLVLGLKANPSIQIVQTENKPVFFVTSILSGGECIK